LDFGQPQPNLPFLSFLGLTEQYGYRNTLLLGKLSEIMGLPQKYGKAKMMGEFYVN